MKTPVYSTPSEPKTVPDCLQVAIAQSPDGASGGRAPPRSGRAWGARPASAGGKTLVALGYLALILAAIPPLPAAVTADSGPLGLFTDHADIGATSRPGTATFTPAQGTYTVGASGANIWAAADAFHYAWTKVDGGDVSLAADISFAAPGGDPHRKACLMLRQSLDANSTYADVALHGVGLASLQFRDGAGETTHEIQLPDNAPRRLRIEKRGRYLSVSVAGADGVLRPAGGVVRVEFNGPFYVGLGVCAHNNTAFETAVFANVELLKGAAVAASAPPKQLCTIETIEVASLNRKVIHTTEDHLEAPNWSRDGATLLFNGGDRLIHRLPVAGGKPETVNTGPETRVNNDHGLSPDGTLLAISDQSQGGDNKSRIYLLPAGGGTPRPITPDGPSYWHGWSPDGLTLVFCGARTDNRPDNLGKTNFDVYSIPAAGGPETRLTTDPGLDDGPEYSPDGKFIYFNSERTGKMQIWRMHPDGSGQEPVTADTYNNWFAHPSPDGKWLAFISFEPDVKPNDHSGNKPVMLRLMPVAGGKIIVAAKLFGGQGTMNVPSWSPDSRSFAFVSYTPVTAP
jgi:TolB protein